MSKSNFKNIDEYHEQFPEDIKSRLQQIREIITKISPDSMEVISYQIPAFKVNNAFLIYYSAYTNHISISSPWSREFLKHFQTELIPYKVSKSAIQIPHHVDLPKDLIKRIITYRLHEVLEQHA